MKRPALMVTGAIAFVICCALIFAPDYDSPRVIKFLILSQVMFGLSIMIFLIARKIDFDHAHRWVLYAVVALALLARVVMLVGAGDKFYLSDDVYRYIWDGRMTAIEINPYLYAPNNAILAPHVDSVIHPQINHPWVPTIYPPMAQNIFVAAYYLGGGQTWGFKVIAVLFELLTIVAIAIWLYLRGIPRVNLLLWLFSPLILIEFYLSTHLDILGMPFLVACLITAHEDRPTLSGMFLAMATLVKFYGLFLFPFLFLMFKGQRKTRFVLSYIAAIVALYLPYVIGAGTEVFGSLFTYLGKWQYNASIYLLLRYGLKLDIAPVIVGSAFVLWMTWLFFRRTDPFNRMFKALAGYVVLTTTLFPWYMVWIFPFILENLSAAFIFLTGSVLLSYHVHIGFYSGGKSSVIMWFGLLEYVPFYILLIAGSYWSRRLKSSHA